MRVNTSIGLRYWPLRGIKVVVIGSLSSVIVFRVPFRHGAGGTLLLTSQLLPGNSSHSFALRLYPGGENREVAIRRQIFQPAEWPVTSCHCTSTGNLEDT